VNNLHNYYAAEGADATSPQDSDANRDWLKFVLTIPLVVVAIIGVAVLFFI